MNKAPNIPRGHGPIKGPGLSTRDRIKIGLKLILLLSAVSLAALGTIKCILGEL